MLGGHILCHGGIKTTLFTHSLCGKNSKCQRVGGVQNGRKLDFSSPALFQFTPTEVSPRAFPPSNPPSLRVQGRGKVFWCLGWVGVGMG